MTVDDGNTITAPVVVQARSGEQFALLFEENRTGELAEQLHVFALDPNRDGSFRDATFKTTVSVGRSLIEGHSGHHEVTAIGRAFVGISNPGDGTIVILSTNDWSVQATLPVGGVPTRLVAVGG
ncbi:MAG: hypothetical protein NXI32_29480 [bacterium]|nr:hypothetical protein [bacterium]